MFGFFNPDRCSDEVRAVLGRASQIAEQRGSAYVRPSDVLAAVHSHPVGRQLISQGPAGLADEPVESHGLAALMRQADSISRAQNARRCELQHLIAALLMLPGFAGGAQPDKEHS